MPFDGTNPPKTTYKKGQSVQNNPTNNPWKDDKNTWYTLSLFYELCREDDRKNALYTIYEKDRTVNGKTYKSLRDEYFSYNHIPGHEYEFANDWFGGWDHWQVLLKSGQRLRDVFKGWQEELEVKLMSQAVKGIIATSKDNTPTAFQAMKYLADKGWIPKKGRPSKAAIEREAKIQAGVDKEVQEDLARIKLVK